MFSLSFQLIFIFGEEVPLTSGTLTLGVEWMGVHSLGTPRSPPEHPPQGARALIPASPSPGHLAPPSLLLSARQQFLRQVAEAWLLHQHTAPEVPQCTCFWRPSPGSGRVASGSLPLPAPCSASRCIWPGHLGAYILWDTLSCPLSIEQFEFQIPYSFLDFSIKCCVPPGFVCFSVWT